MKGQLQQRRTKARMRDVAREAEVAIGTVSRVLNSHKDVSAELVRRVMEAVRATGYIHTAQQRVPDRMRKSDKGGGDIGALFFSGDPNVLTRADALRMLDGIERELASKGRSLVVGRADRDALIPSFLASRRIDGLLLIGLGFEKESADWMEQAYGFVRSFPHVWVNARPPAVGGDFCGPDIQRAGRLAAEYFAKMGHRRVGFFSTGSSLVDPPLIRASFAAAAKDSGLESSVLDLLLEPAAEASSRVAARLLEFLSEIPGELQPTALFVPDYEVAFHFSELMSRMGKMVSLLTCAPQEPEPDRAGAAGKLTMIDMRYDSLSTRAVAQLLLRMRDPADDAAWVNLSVEPVVIERGSVERLADSKKFDARQVVEMKGAYDS